MAGLAVAASAALVATGITAVQGQYVQQERYQQFYANGVTPDNFFTDANPLMHASPDERVRTFEPSVPKVSFMDRIDFPAGDRPSETRIFTGVIDISECFAGDYIFRITSDDASHLVLDGEVVIDNGGWHGPQSKWTHVTLKRGQKYHMQLWWGNADQGSTMKLEYCQKTDAQSANAELMDVLKGDTIGGIAGDLFSDADLALSGCDFTTDLSGIFVKHEMPFVLRTDYNGYFGQDVEWFNTNVMAKKETKWLPEGHAYEVGGVIAANADGDGKDECTKKSFHFHTTIAARVSGVHTFWVEADDGAMLYIAGKEIVNNDGWHAPRWRKGSVFLQEGQKQALDVYYGNDQYPGILTVKWEDPLTSEPMASLLPIMV